jgi:HD-GYP domain-containing protein (c-di-GMP phosphodiesterase class II)
MAFGSFIGVLEVISNRQRLFTPADLEFVQPLTNLVALTLPREDNKTIMHLAEVCIRFLEERDRYTHGHSVRVTNYALIIAEEMQLSEAQKYDLRLAALLHDIGKITLKDTLLAKDNHLTKLELQAIRMHPIISHNIVVGISRPLARIIRYHHENYNGTGYPEGLRGEEIPFMSRLICLADAFDAMTTDRPYRSAMDIEFVLKEIREGSDKQFDPRVVKAFLAVYQEGKINLYQPAPAGRPQEQGVV